MKNYIKNLINIFKVKLILKSYSKKFKNRLIKKINGGFKDKLLKIYELKE